jgi:hypothetical protein
MLTTDNSFLITPTFGSGQALQLANDKYYKSRSKLAPYNVSQCLTHNKNPLAKNKGIKYIFYFINVGDCAA